MGGSSATGESRRASAPGWGAWRAAGVAPLLLLLATCQVDKLTNNPPPIARLMLAPGQVRDSAPVGSMAAADDSLSVANGGPGTLSWVAHLATGGSWLAFVGPNSGTAPATLRIAFNPAGLPTGVYRDTVIVDAENAANSPGRVPVEFTVHPCMPTPVVVNAPPLTDSLTTADCVAPHRSTSFARLYSFTGAAGDSVTIAMSSTAVDAFIVLDTSADNAAPAFATNDSCSGGNDACLRYQRLPVAGTYRIEATSAGAAQTGVFTLSVTRPRAPVAAQSLAQLRGDSITTIAVGGTTDQGGVVLRGLVTDPDAGDSLRLQVELQPVGTTFTGTPTATGARVANGQIAFVAATGLANNAAYHWQARALDQTGRAGPWTSFGGNAESAPDFSTSIPVPPNAPTGLGQFQSDGTTAIAVGGTATGRSVAFKATVTDPNPGDQLRLDVEVEAVGTAFTGTANGSGVAVANGGTATAFIAGLRDSTSYHWQGRAVDQTGRSSPWASFGSNLESDADFRVAISATQLVFTVQPGTTTAGSAITPAVQLTAQDALGNPVTSFNGNVSLTLGANPSGGTLGGTTTVVAVNGVATFADLHIDKAGSGYTLQAATTTLNGASATFSVVPAAATHLVFTAQPTTTAAGALITPAIQVTARDAFDNTATGFTGNVTVSLDANAAGGTLSGTTTVAAVNGVAAFGNLSINRSGSGYTLGATAAGPSGATSNPFDIIPASATRLVFTVQPSNATAGAALTPAVQVTAQDAQGNTVTGFTANVTLALANNPGGGTLSGTTTVAAVAGVASFGTLSVNRSGVGYTLQVSAGSLSGGPSSAFTITPGPATQLAITQQPTGITAGSIVTPAMRVTALDAQGNTATAFTGNVIVALGNNPGGSVLSGTTTMAAVAGVATFGDLSLDKAGTGYTLTANATGLSGTTSAAFTVSPASVNKLVFTVPPSNTTAGVTIAPAVQVTAQDALGNTVTTFTGTVTVALGNNPGNGTLSGTTSAAAASGVATFATLSVNRAGSGYTLTAAASGLTTASSAAFNVAPGAASTLQFTVQPSTTVAGATITPAVQVTALDAQGNTATGFTGNVSVAIGTNPGGGTLTGTTTVAAVSGVATFSTLSINRSGVGYTLSGVAPGLATSTSAGFGITPGAATQLAFTGQPTNVTAGAAITPAVQVTARDALGNAATGFSGTITIALATNPGGGTLAGTATAAAVNGVATFANASIDKTATGYQLGAAAAGLASATSSSFDVTAGAASQLVFTVEPSNATAGAAIAPAVQVTARDAQGNRATAFTGNVTVALGANPGGGTMSGTTTIAAVGGVATFSNLSINRAGTGYTLVTSAAGLGNTASTAFDVAAGAASQLVFTAQPSNATAGVAITPAVQVSAQDALGNTVLGFTGTVTIALGNNAGGGTLSGTSAVAATNGVATFGDLSINRVGVGYTMSATATGTSPATSGAFNITSGTASQLVFTVQPSATVAGSTITPAVQVTARDALGNTATGFGGNVSVALAANPGGATLSGTTTAAAVSGVATFAGLSLNRAATGYTLAANTAGLASTTSAAFSVTAGTATTLVFTVEPTNTVAGASITPAVQVTAQDALGNTDLSFTGNVTVALATNPTGAALGGTATVAASSGIATFANLSVNKAGNGYALSATATGLTAGGSSGFNVAAGTATHLVFTVQPTTVGAGSAITPAVQVSAQDPLGNTDPTFTGGITVAIGTNPSGGTLSGTTTVSAVAGVASFATLAIDKVGTGYTLTAGGGSLTGGPSAAFDVTAGSATHLAFSVQPTSTTAGSVVTPAVRVTALDGQGNIATAFTANVTLALGANPGAATLSGTVTVAAVSGVATFGDLSLNKTGTGYTLTASATGPTSATSTTFDIAPAAANKLVFTVQPTSATAGATLTPAVQITAQDGLGNTVTSFTGTVTVALGNNAGGGSLGGTTSVTATAGVATFSNLSVNRSGTGYTLTGTATGLTTAGSTAFDITPGPAAQLAFTVQPITTTAGAAIAPAVQVTAQDAQGNTATGFSGNITVALGANPGGGTLSGTSTVAAAAGVASFVNLSINHTGTGYTLVAAATGVSGGTSAAFNVTPGAATQLAFTVQPGTTTAGVAITPAVQVTVRDALGNVATQFTGNVTVALGTNPGAGTLSGTTTVAASAGVATFATLSINRAGAGYTLTVAATGVSGATSTPFTIAAGAATHLAFIIQPTSTVAGASITPAVQVAAQDALGNTDPTFTANVTVALGANPGGGTLSGTATVAAVNGVATFAGLSIDKVGAGYTLAASGGGVAAATSGAFTITPGSAARLVFTIQPTSTTSGAAITPAVQVTAQDAQGNTAAGFTGNVTVAIGANPGSGTLSGTTTVAAASGLATFSTLSINRSGTGYTLTAAATSVSGATSGAFDVTPGAATQLVFTVQPTTTAAGATVTPAVQVTARDALGNAATEFNGSITVAIGTNPAGGTLSGTTTVIAANGMATFSTLSINRAGAGYTLTAAATGLSGATSVPFTIAAGSATHLVYTVQPTSTSAGTAIAPAVQVSAQDALGNTDPTFTGSVTLSLGANPGGGTLSGTTTAAAVSGVATFANLSIDKVGTGYTLAAAATGVTGTTSSTFNIAPGAATRLVFTVQPTNTVAGAAITPAVQVTVQDAQGNTASGFTGNVTVAIGTNPGGGTLAGPTTIAAVSGVGMFSSLSINKAGTGYTLTTSATGLTGAVSAAFNVTPGTASTLQFTVQPTTTVAGAAITPAVQVTAQDALGNTLTSFTGTVTVALGNNPGGGALSGTSSVAATAGVATFSNLSVNRTGPGYTLTATATGFTTAGSAAFDITPGSASQLVFTVQPTSTTAGAAIAPAVQVTAQDAQGNTASAFNGTVTVALGANPGSGTLSGTTSVAATGGVATFSSLSINRSGTGYTLTAAATGVPGGTSVPFNVTPGAAATLAFTVQPGNTTAGATITPAVQVTARDALGNTATQFTGSVTVAIGTNPSGGTLSGSNTATAVAGVATFANLSIDKAGAGYALSAASTGLTGSTSGTFNVTAGAATHVVFTVQPSTTGSAAPITPAVQVSAQDGLGNTDPTFTGNLTVALGTNPGGGTLSGTTTVAANAGVATFATLTIDKVGTGYTLTAAASGLTGATSSAFNVVPGAATHLMFTVQPTSATAGSVITPAVQATALDAQGNTVTTFTGTVSVALGANPGSATLSGTLSAAAVGGVATFGDLSLNRTGTGYTLTATATGLTAATSAAFNIAPAPANKLVFTVQPSNTSAGATITPAVQVTAQDGLGNTVTSFTGTVTVALGNNPGSGTLSGTTSVAATAGVATFSTLSINRSATGYTFTGTASGLATAASTAFDVTAGAAAQLSFTVQPSNTTAGATITPAVQVTAQDAQGNTASGFTGNVTVAIGINSGGGTLAGTTTVAAVSGIATFSTLSINKAGTGYTLTAAATGPAGATSSAFDITAGGATQLAFTVQPSSAVAGAALTPAVQVTARDALGNTATGFTGGVTVAIGTNPGNGTLSGTTSLAAVNGVATFANLSVNKVGTGYTLSASATGVTSASSAAFTITPGSATQLVFTVQPSNTAAAASITPAVQLTAEDGFGNPDPTFTGSVTVALGANPGAGTLSGTTTVAAVSGVAEFPGLSVDKSGTGYTLTGTATGLATGTSGAFNVTAGAATQLVFTVEPSNATATQAITPAVQLTARDAQGNTATGFTGTVTVAIGANPGGGVLAGTTSLAAVAGVATFSNLSINKVGSGYTLTAASTGFSGATSTPFDVAPGAATHLAFSVPPSTTPANAIITPPIQVTALDASNNVATGFSGNIVMAIPAGSNPGGGTLAGTKTVAAVSGVATFSDLSINNSGTGYRLRATSSGLTGVSSAQFNITALTQLVFTVQPGTIAAGGTITPAVQVTAEDAAGRVGTGFTGNVSIAIGANPGGGALSGTTTVAAVSGVASFSTLSIDKAGVGYTLSAAATGLTTATSSSFDVSPGSATHLAFAVQPSNSVAGASITPAVQLTAQDAQGNTDPSFTGNVTVALQANPAGGTLTGTTTVAAVSGVATFSTLSLNKAGTGYSLAGSATSLTGATSNPFNVTAGAATQLVFTVQPSNTTSGAAIAPAMQVTAQDAQANVATSFAGTVALAIAKNPGGGTLGGTTSVTAANGVATFATVTIDKVGVGYALAASSGTLTGATSSGFNVVAGTVSASQSTVTATSPIAAGSGTSTITVTAKDANGNPIEGATVVLAATGTGNTVTQPTATTNSNGVASGTLASTVAEAKTVSATINSVGITQTATVVVAAGTVSAAQSTVAATSPITAGSGTSTITVTAKDASGNPIQGATVVLAATPTAGNTLTQPTGPTDLNGVATGTLSSTAAGSKTVSATINSVGITQTATVVVTPGAVSAGQSTVTATSPIAAGTGSSTITVTAKDGLGNPIPGATVVLGATGTANTLTQPSGPTGADGVATGTLSSPVAESKTVSATINGVGVTQTATVVVQASTVSGAQSSLAATSPITASSGSSASTITVTARDALGNPVAGATVLLAATGTGNTVTQPSATTNSSGVATGTLSSTVAESKTVSATINGVAVTQTATVAVNPGAVSATQSTVAATSPITAGSGTSTITVTAKDANGNPIQGATVVLAATGTGNTLTQPTTTTNASGVATGTLSSTAAESKTLSTTINSVAITQTATVVVNPGSVSASQSTVAATSPITAGSGTSTITVTAKDASGNPIQGATVVLAATPTAGNTLTQPTGPTDVNGVATGTLSSTAAGSKTVSATINTVAITQTATVVVNPGSVSASQSTVAATSPIAAGSGTSTITVTAKDAQGNLIAGATVVLAATGTGNTLTQPAAVTNGSGVATGTLSSSVAESKTVSATINSVAVTQTATVVVNAGDISATQSTLAATSPITVGTTTSTITVTAKDGLGNPVQGATVVLSATGTGNTLTQPATTTSAAGVATGSLSSSVAESKTVSATINGVAVTQTATVVVNAASTTTAIGTHNPNPSVVGQGVGVTYSVTSAGGTPTGSVTVSDGAASCTATVAAAGCTLTPTTAGAKTLTATYAGDGNFTASTSTGAAHTVNPAGTTTTITAHTPNPSAVGQAVTFTFTVVANAPGSGAPTGTVTVSDGTQNCSATVAVGSCSISFGSSGARSVTATYATDGNFAGSTSASVSQSVGAASTTTTITAHTPNPSTVGQGITINFTVTSTGGTPTGNVTVSDGAATCVGTVAAGTCTLTSTTAGAKTLTATYEGDANFAGSTSAGLSHTVNAAGTTTAITGHTPSTSVTGQPVAVTFSVTSAGGTPTGNVTVSDGAATCSGTVAAGTCTLTPTTAGAKTLTATYAGDGNFTGSASTGVAHTVNPAGTTTTITGNTPNPSAVGQAVTFTFTVTANAPGSGTPTGTVTMSDGTQNCSATLAVGSCSISFGSSGARSVTATYATDGNFAGSTSAGVSQTVNAAGTTTAITGHTPSPSVTGQPVVVTFTVTSTGGTPTGNVSVSDGSATCGGTVAAGTCTLTPTTAGAKTLTATYAGDGNFSGSASTGVAHTVNAASTTATITGNVPNPSAIGQSVTISFTVVANAPGSGSPTGTVTVSDGSLNCSASVATGSCSIVFGTVGGRTLTATYASDGNYAGSTSTGVTQTVGQASTTTSITGHTPNPSVVGQGIPVTFAVTSSGGTPTGNVTLSDGSATCVGTVAAGTCTLTPTTAGAKTLSATYGGDANFGGSVSVGVSHTVNAANTTTTLAAGTPNPAVVGQPVSFPFTVLANAPGSGTPTGAVTVSDGTQSCAASVATGTCSIAFATAGGRTMTASYAGDGNYAVSGSSGVSQAVNAAGTVTTITGDTPDPSTVGQPYTVTYTVAVSAPGSGSPAGNVTVSDGTATCNGTVATGSCSLISLTPGAKTLTATYAGNADFATSTSGGEAHTVTLTGTSTAITAHSPNPSVVGEGIAVIYTVTPASGSGTPTGNVTVSDGAATCVASVAVSTCTLTPTTAGAKTLTASYPGDATFAGSTSPGVGQTVNPASTTTAITSNSPNPSVAGQPIAVHFSVTSTGGTPTGSVTVSDGAASCVTSVAAGTCNLTPTIAGSRTLTATYAGDANFSGSTSPGVSQTVNPDAVSATQSTLVAAPTSITASNGTSQSTITVTAKDGFGNPISGASVVLSASGSGNALSLPPATDGNGVSTATLSSTVAEDKKISATINGVAISQGATVTVVAGTATQLQFTTQPSDVNVLGTIQVVATAFDAFGNTATSFGGNVTVAIGNDASLPPPATLSGTLTVAPTLGVATFGDLTIDKAGVGYTLVVNASGLTGATSNAFTVIALP